MRRTAILLTLTAVAAATTVRAQQVDLRIATGELGYGSPRITGMTAVADQVSKGIDARLDVHILSLLLRNLPLRTYDALFVDASYGRLTSDTLPGLFAGDSQPRYGFSYYYGYQFLVGRELPGVAVLGGLGWQDYYHDVGGSTMQGKSTTAVGRVEIGGRRPIVVTGWKSVSGVATFGARVDIPFFRRLALSATYWQTDGMVDLFSRGLNDPLVPGRAKMLVIGFRSVELR